MTSVMICCTVYTNLLWKLFLLKSSEFDSCTWSNEQVMYKWGGNKDIVEMFGKISN